MVLFVLLFALFYPSTFAIVDEDTYLTGALLFRSGRLTFEGSAIPPPHQSVEHNGRIASKYPPGNSLFLLPFLLINWRAAFVSGLLLALISTLLLRACLVKFDPAADPNLALLWLFYPAVTLYSRTLMSDLLSATLILGALYLLVSRRFLLTGVLLGAACLVRYANAIVVPIFLLLLPAERRTRSAVALLTGFLPFVAAILFYNNYVFGGPFQFPMYLTGFFSPVFFPKNASIYAVNLLLCYPGMLVAPLLVGPGHRRLLLLPGLALLLPYCFFSFVYEGGLTERLTIGMRYLLPALPFFVLAFALVTDRLLRQFRGTAVLKYLLISLTVAASIIISYRHSRYLQVQTAYRNRLYRQLPADGLLLANPDASELISPVWGVRRYQHYVEFNVPMLSQDVDTLPLYGTLLEKPGDTQFAERAAFFALLSRYPNRVLLDSTMTPYRFWLYRLIR